MSQYRKGWDIYKMLNRIKVGWKMWTGGFAFSRFTLYLQNKLDTVTSKPSPGTPLRIYCGTD